MLCTLSALPRLWLSELKPQWAPSTREPPGKDFMAQAQQPEEQMWPIACQLAARSESRASESGGGLAEQSCSWRNAVSRKGSDRDDASGVYPARRRMAVLHQGAK